MGENDKLKLDKIKCPLHHKELSGVYSKMKDITSFVCHVKGCSVVIHVPGEVEGAARR